jgi:hypothetical protein
MTRSRKPQVTTPTGVFEPHKSQDLDDRDLLAAGHTRHVIAEAEVKLARYRAALESGTDPALITTWTAEVTAAKAEAQAKLRGLRGRQRPTKDEIATLVTTAGSVMHVLRQADGRDKAAVYHQLGLRLTYQTEPKAVIADAQPSAIMYETECPRGDRPIAPTPASGHPSRAAAGPARMRVAPSAARGGCVGAARCRRRSAARRPRSW